MTANNVTANDVLSALIAGAPVPAWIRETLGRFTSDGQSYETTAVNFFPEVTVRLPRDGKTRRGKPRFQRRRMDLVALVQPHYREWNPVAVGVEIKVDVHDLRNDIKMGEYMEYVHLFYVAVPPVLKDEAMSIVTGSLFLAGLLLIDEDRVEIAKWPGKLWPSPKCVQELYAELLIRPFKLARKSCKNFYQFLPNKEITNDPAHQSNP